VTGAGGAGERRCERDDARRRREPSAPVWAIADRVQLAAGDERAVADHAGRAYECGALGLRARLQISPVGPPRDLAPRREREGCDLVA
jgi:hypothetical protein